MNLDEVITHGFERFNAAVGMWNFLATVVLGLLAFLAAAERAFRGWRVRTLLSLAYLFFAAVNLYILTGIEAQRRALEAAARSMMSKQVFYGLADTIRAPPPIAIAEIHMCTDAAVVIAIWLIPSLLRKDVSSGG